MKISTLLIAFVLSLPLLSLSSCHNGIKGNGNVKEEAREVNPFTKLSISGAYKVYLQQGNTYELKVEADENLLPLIKSENKGEWLKIYTDEPFAQAKSLKLYITVVDIDEIDISGAVEILGKSLINSNKLDIELSGAGEINLDLDVIELDLDLSGGSETVLRGFAQKLDVDISGAGELEAGEFETAQCSIDISGAGEATLYVTEELDVDISGAGEIKYKGNPHVTKDVAGAGSIVSID